MTAVLPTLSSAETRRRKKLERVVADGVVAVFEVGAALRELRDSGLYRSTHETFEAYARDLWDYSRSRAYQLMDAHAVSTIVDIGNEAQARELVPVLRAGGPEAVKSVVASVDERATTAGDLRDAATRWLRRARRRRGRREPEGEAVDPGLERQAELFDVLYDARSVPRNSLGTRVEISGREFAGAVRSLIANGVAEETGRFRESLRLTRTARRTIELMKAPRPGED